MTEHAVEPVDPFDLPEWLGVDDVTWTTVTSLGSAALVAGTLRGTGPETCLECDVLAGDLAYPAPVLADRWRSRAHHAWSLGEALLLRYDGRLTLVVPGSVVGVEPALEAVRRLAKAVGAPSSRFTVAIRL